MTIEPTLPLAELHGDREQFGGVLPNNRLDDTSTENRADVAWGWFRSDFPSLVKPMKN
jgi:hypothetical protein